MKKLLQILSVSLLLFLFGCSEEKTLVSENPISTSKNLQEKSSIPESFKSEKTNETIEEGSKEESESNNFISAKVVEVTDGDTLKISINGKTESVRLLLVDTPETVHPSKPVQPFGPEASKFAKDTLTGKNVQVEFDVSNRDKYGRLLAYIHTDGKMFNEMLLEKGLARVAYIYAPNTKHVDEFYKIQKQAQSKGIGIWSIENYAQESGFNSESNKTVTNPPPGIRSQDCENPNIKGNISSSGEKIYHLPEGQFYDVTKAEAYFCSEEDAVSSGYRKSQR